MSAKDVLKMFSFVVCALAAALYGVSAGLPYLVIMYILYPIIVSMCLQHWKDKGKIIIETEENRAIFYTQFGTIHEDMKSLQNFCTTSEKSLENIYKRLLILKVVLTLLFIFWVFNENLFAYQKLLQQFRIQNIFDIAAVIGVAVINFVIFSVFIKTIKLWLLISQHKWYIHHHIEDNKFYFSAYQQHNDEYKSLLLQIM